VDVLSGTPSPSDSGVGELEAMLKEKETEILLLRQVMDRNERAIFQVTLKILKTSLLSKRDIYIRLPDISSSNKCKLTSNTRQKEEKQQNRTIHVRVNAHTHKLSHTDARTHAQTYTHTHRGVCEAEKVGGWGQNKLVLNNK
jgi:hypothetical protein